MKIAFISFWTCPLEHTGVMSAGGMNIYMHYLANFLGRSGNIVDIYTKNHKGKDIRILKPHKNVRVIHLNTYGKDGRDKAINFGRNVSNYIKKNGFDYDIYHAHYYYSMLSGMVIKEKTKRPLFGTFHTLGINKEKSNQETDKGRISLEKNIVKKLDGIIASTELEKDDLIKYYSAKSNKIYVIPPGVDHKIFRIRTIEYCREKLGLPQNKKIILFIGRIDPIKGISSLIEAVYHLSRIHADFKEAFQVILIGGDIKSRVFWQNEEVVKIKKLIIKWDLECCVKFIGSKPHHMLSYYYSASDIVVMPSKYESFGLVVLEAMSAGKAILASKVGGLKLLIRDGVNGLSFEMGNQSQMEKKLYGMLNDDNKREIYGKKALYSSQDYCWSKQAEKMIEVYKKYI